MCPDAGGAGHQGVEGQQNEGQRTRVASEEEKRADAADGKELRKGNP